MTFYLNQTRELQNRKRESLSRIIIFAISFAAGGAVFLLSRNVLFSLIGFLGFFALLLVYIYFKRKLADSVKIKKIESVFPDFIELMSSNLRAGMTLDRALLLSSRKEFAPLDAEIFRLGKDIVTGKDISTALHDMAKRIKSDKIEKTINIIVSGIVSGGNVSILLEETASMMRERIYVEKKASSNVLMYVIFIFFAAGIGAPVLFGLSSVLVDVLSGILSTLPSAKQLAATRLPFTLTNITVSPVFIKYFSLVFLCAINILAGMVLGLVNKGEERAGIRYIPWLLLLSISVFFIVRYVLHIAFAGFGAF